MISLLSLNLYYFLRRPWLKWIGQDHNVNNQQHPSIIVVGCNKGDDFINLMQHFSGNQTYDTNKLLSLWKADPDYSKAMKEYAERRSRWSAGFACGHQYLNHSDMNSSTLRILPITGFCIEPLPATFAKLTQFMMRDLQLDNNEIRLVNQAMGARDHQGTALFIDAPAGTTVVGLDTSVNVSHSQVRVKVSNLDTLISMNGISNVDFLSIDSEGTGGVLNMHHI